MTSKEVINAPIGGAQIDDLLSITIAPIEGRPNP